VDDCRPKLLLRCRASTSRGLTSPLLSSDWSLLLDAALASSRPEVEALVRNTSGGAKKNVSHADRQSVQARCVGGDEMLGAGHPRPLLGGIAFVSGQPPVIIL